MLLGEWIDYDAHQTNRPSGPDVPCLRGAHAFAHLVPAARRGNVRGRSGGGAAPGAAVRLAPPGLPAQGQVGGGAQGRSVEVLLAGHRLDLLPPEAPGVPGVLLPGGAGNPERPGPSPKSPRAGRLPRLREGRSPECCRHLTAGWVERLAVTRRV